MATRMQVVTPLIDSLIDFAPLPYTWSAEAKKRSKVNTGVKISKTTENVIDSIKST